MPLQVGDRIGDYEVIGVLGAGGMGKVYKVRSALSNRIEAMKVLLPDLAASDDLSERFLREIRLQATLTHPNIAALYTALKIDNQMLMFMEFVEGTPLNELLAQKQISVAEALDYTSQVLSALEYAHAQGIVHRDIKPSNMIRTPSGTVKLLDFGIARVAMDRKLTASGGVVGSLQYMSPEQIQAGNVDARSDLYSLGICLYEMVTHKKPFDADSQFALMDAHIRQAPRPPIELDPALSPDLNEVILLALAKNPDERFQSATAMRNALESIRANPAFRAQAAGVAAAATLSHAPAPAVTSTMVPPAAPAVAAAATVPPQQFQAPPPPPAQQPPPRVPARASRRGLYMALGSLVTVAVLIAAIIFIPRFIRARAGAQLSAQSSSAVPTPAPAPAASQPAVPDNTASQPAPVQTTAPADNAQPAPTAPAAPAPPRIARAAAPSSAAAQQPTTDAPAQPSAAQQAAAAEMAAHQAAITELHTTYDQLSVRVSSVHGGLQSLQAQMGGMGLRADMREAATRMDALMQTADRQIQAGDVDAATKTLDTAEIVVAQLEKFLGR